MTIQPGQHHVITLGTSGGPRFWKDSNRSGIATAIVVQDGFYLVDCGTGVGRQIERAGLALADLKGIFLTHMHSDHTVDLNTLALFGLFELGHRIDHPMPIFGPGDRGMLPPISPQAATPPAPLAPEQPTPGTKAMFEQLMKAHATDLNDRILDALRPSPLELFAAHDIVIPSASGYHPQDNPTPSMAPFVVYQDDCVTVRAILVEHPPIAPAFAFRFDTAQGSVAISGDTTFTQNMVTLSQDAGLILHEALDFDFIDNMYAHKTDAVSKASRDHHYKSHTSPEDAIKVARLAGARRLALHHLVPGMKSEEHWRTWATDFPGEFYIPQDLDALPID